MNVQWTPVPGGVKPGTYDQAAIGELHVELWWNSSLLRWEWSVYDPDSFDPDTAVTREWAFFRDNAEKDLFEWVHDYLHLTEPITSERT